MWSSAPLLDLLLSNPPPPLLLPCFPAAARELVRIRTEMEGSLRAAATNMQKVLVWAQISQRLEASRVEGCHGHSGEDCRLKFKIILSRYNRSGRGLYRALLDHFVAQRAAEAGPQQAPEMLPELEGYGSEIEVVADEEEAVQGSGGVQGIGNVGQDSGAEVIVDHGNGSARDGKVAVRIPGAGKEIGSGDQAVVEGDAEAISRGKVDVQGGVGGGCEREEGGNRLRPWQGRARHQRRRPSKFQAAARSGKASAPRRSSPAVARRLASWPSTAVPW